MRGVVRRILLDGFIGPVHREFEGDLQQGHEHDGKCGLSEIVLFRFDLASRQEARVVDRRRVLVLHRRRVFHSPACRAGGRGEAVVKTPRPAGHDSEGAVESLQALGDHPGFVD